LHARWPLARAADGTTDAPRRSAGIVVDCAIGWIGREKGGARGGGCGGWVGEMDGDGFGARCALRALMNARGWCKMSRCWRGIDARIEIGCFERCLSHLRPRRRVKTRRRREQGQNADGATKQRRALRLLASYTRKPTHINTTYIIDILHARSRPPLSQPTPFVLLCPQRHLCLPLLPPLSLSSLSSPHTHAGRRRPAMAESSSAPGSAWNARNPAVKRILQVGRETRQRKKKKKAKS
jgi:hypothetical protein